MKSIRKSKGTDFKLKIFLLLLAIGIIFIAVKYCRENIIISEVLERVEQAGLWAPVFYTLLYILLSGVIIPSIVIKIFAGTLFGIVWGIIIVSIAATVSSLIKFLLARYLFRENIQKKIERSEKLKAIDRVIERDGWKMLVILRNVPVVNSMALNYICGLTKMSVKTFVVASFIGRLPTTVMYIYLGYLLRYTYKAGTETDVRHLALERIMLFIGLMAIAGASIYLVYLSRKILAEKAPAVTAPNLKK